MVGVAVTVVSIAVLTVPVMVGTASEVLMMMLVIFPDAVPVGNAVEGSKVTVVREPFTLDVPTITVVIFSDAVPVGNADDRSKVVVITEAVPEGLVTIMEVKLWDSVEVESATEDSG